MNGIPQCSRAMRMSRWNYKSEAKFLLSEIEKADEIFTNAENFVKLIECYTDVKELSAKILNELIDRIVVRKPKTQMAAKAREWIFTISLSDTSRLEK